MINWIGRIIKKDDDRDMVKIDIEITSILTQIAALIESKRRMVREREEYLDTRFSYMESRQKTLNLLRAELSEREAVLKSIRESIEAEKEAFLGKDGIELKRKILLPAMQAKWEAESKKLDAERNVILNSMPAMRGFLSQRKKEIETQIAEAKGKPANSGNSMLIVQGEAALSEILWIEKKIDEERSKNASISVPAGAA
jgi:hypothetical protein